VSSDTHPTPRLATAQLLAKPPKMAATAPGNPEDVLIHLALPKGHMQENVFKLMEDAGIKVRGHRWVRSGDTICPRA
jgi:hypothetical protein